jgi:hypothetical protein
MRKVSVLLIIALLVIFASIAYSQSLGDLAKKEKERRAEVRNDKVITNDEAAKYSSGSEAAKILIDKTPEVSAGRQKDSENEETVDFQGKTESYWRKTMSDARQSVKNFENEANVLVLKLNQLQNQFYKEADGFRRETVQREIQKTYYEQDLNKTNLEKSKAALKDLENEARKSGALPGWIESKNP